MRPNSHAAPTSQRPRPDTGHMLPGHEAELLQTVVKWLRVLGWLLPAALDINSRAVTEFFVSDLQTPSALISHSQNCKEKVCQGTWLANRK